MSSGKKEIFNKLYVKQWVIGLIRADIREVIRTRTLKQDIKWLPVDSIDHFYGDPFLLKTPEDNISILFEDFSFDENYGNISLLTLDKNLNPADRKVLLDNGSHLSYPFIFKENDRIYVFPESARTGNLSCYEYDPIQQSLGEKREIIRMPLLDSSVIKHNNKYWILGTLKVKPEGYRLLIFYSDTLFGPYVPHRFNPVKSGFDATRQAGNFIEVDGNIYRPSQNCKTAYGESITINKIRILNENSFEEEPYMEISIDEKNREDYGINTIHTINVLDNHLITVDGIKWTFSPGEQFRNYLRNRRHLQNAKRQKAVSD